MLRHIKNKLFSIYLEITSSISFYPSIIAFGLFLLAFILLSWEDKSMSTFLIENASFLVINNADTARSILSTLIGGLISLTVFSFSMVMVLLNQASSNFSPRLLPGLISDKKNQIVLGTYLGTIIYNIIVLISIDPSGDKYTINGFSILIGIALGVLCLAMFVFFIHTISTGIQINNILNQIFLECKKGLTHLIEIERKKVDPILDNASWKTLFCKDANYFQGVNINGLKEFASKAQIELIILPFKGKYMLPGMPILKCNHDLDEHQEKIIFDFFIFSSSHSVGDNYILGINQITEVGIKAMSPAVNDPGTAAMTIDYLTELLALRMQIDENEIYQDEGQTYKIELKTVNFHDLIYQCLAAYRQYCKHDMILMTKIIQMIQYLNNCDCINENYKQVLKVQMSILKEDVESNISNKADKERLYNLVNNL